MKKVVVCDPIHEIGFKILREAEDIELVDASKTPKDELLKIIEDADGVITRSPTPVDDKFLNAVKKLKAVVRAGVGVDNVDIDGASKKGIIVMNVPTANTIAAVELTMCHLVSSMRAFPNAVNALKRDKEWNREKWLGNELYGKKLGVIGFGNIGSRVAIRAKSFGMEIIAYDPYINPSKVTDLGMTYTTNFDDILSCDVITIHTPKNKETINMITKKEIVKMKDGVRLINVARGGLYNEDDVLEGLRSGKIAWLGIDVFNKEPLEDHPFWNEENTSVTPHIGANTMESQEKIARQAAENIIQAVRGIAYPNALNLPIDTNKTPEWAIKYLELTQKMSYLIAQTINKAIKKIRVTSYGNISEYLDSLLTFAVVGAMTEIVGENVNYVNATFLAKENGIELETIEKNNENSPYKNLIKVELLTDTKSYTISGTMFEDNFRVVEIEGFELEFEPKGNLIFFRNTDVPGVIGEVGMTLAKNNINISDFRLGRNKEGEAVAVILIDSKVEKEVIEELSKLKAALSVHYAQI
jgi:D-3-phosphoglycerate dehydrogenase